MPARAIDCFCIVGIWHILLDDVKSAARPTATGRWTADTACESLHSAPSKADAAPGLHPCACTANVAFGRRVAAAAFKSPRRTALCISPFSFNIPNNPSIHPSSRRRPTSITSRIFPSQLLCFPRLHALAQTTSQFPLKTRALEISSGPSPPPRYSSSAASDFIKLVRKHISSSSALLFHAPLCRPWRLLALISEERPQGPLGKDGIWYHC